VTSPAEQASTQVTERCEPGDQDIEGERRRPHNGGRNPEQRHQGDVGRRPGMSYGRVESRAKEHARGKQQFHFGHGTTERVLRFDQSAELLARHLHGAKVVRTFSSVTSGDLLTDARPIGSPERRAIPLAGDDAAAKSIVARFVSELGFDSLDVGGLSQGRKFEVDSWPAPGLDDTRLS
jgi:hypothetical protein